MATVSPRMAFVCGAAAPFLFLITAVLASHLQGDFMQRLGWGNWPSGLALGPHGWLQVVNFIALGLLLLAFASGVSSLAASGRARAGAALLGAAGIAAEMLAFKGDPPDADGTWHGAIHVVAFFAFVVTVLVGSLLAWLGVRRLESWRGTAGYGAAALALFVPLILLPDSGSAGRYVFLLFFSPLWR